MQENKRSFRVRIEHKELILEEAEKNPVLVTMDFSMPNAKAYYNKCWENLALRLNSLGYGEKSPDKWRRVLVDWMSSIKSKYARFKNEMAMTGGGPLTQLSLNPLEERLMALKGFSCVEGDGETPEVGLSRIVAESTNCVEIINLPTNNSEDSFPLSEEIIVDFTNTRKEKKLPSQKKIKTVQEMHEETLNEMKKINISLGVIADSMKTISNYLKKESST